ncbi:RNA-binding domain-containing protein [Sistotremastrum suecicum HHB10207 ss-3]|uniref:RNA-binding domain-containing protein n=1 Tax=Sistotremastrum suecicum HHB10207 ss-3 TaxID=1314776 RepID=A0A166DC92_9AGAM|nr:RNA-binding domain-containing protein [Sistotremastrum suecicum HHB10207 ss-3]
MAIPPNPTLYVHNLNDKVNREEVCLQLFSLFATHGNVIDIVASKSQKMRGQAFLVFSDLAGATAAMRACEGMMFYDKPLHIEYAKTKSHAILKREDPSFVPPSALRAQAHPPTHLLAKQKELTLTESKKRSRDDDTDGRATKKDKSDRDEDGEEMEIEEDETAPQATPVQQPVAADRPPSNVLLCTNLPQEVTDDVLSVLFQQYRGFQSARVTQAPALAANGQRTKLAQVYFESAELATVAKDAVDGFTLKKGWQMSVAFS